MTHGHDGEDAEHRHLCPTCQQSLPLTKVDFVDVAKAVDADKLTDADVFKRTYLGHGTQSSVFVFQGHAGPFRSHVQGHFPKERNSQFSCGSFAAAFAEDVVA